MCTHVFQPTSEMTALYYSVFVTAKNILVDGYGQRKLCSSKAISKKQLNHDCHVVVYCTVSILLHWYLFFTGPRNDLLDVEIRYEYSDVEVSCRPFTRFEGEPLCEIAYSMDPSSDSYTSESSVLEPSKTLYFEVLTMGGILDVKVMGSFETGTKNKTA